MTNIQELYKQKLTTAEEALKLVKPGEGIIYPIMPGEPMAIHAAMKDYKGFKDNRLYRFLPGTETYTHFDKADLKQYTMFISGADRKAANEGYIEIIPNHFSNTPKILRAREEGKMVLMMTVSPMDEEGNFSLGTSNSYMGSLIEHADKIIIEVNETMPYTYGEKNHVNISQVTALVENNEPIITAGEPAMDERAEAIGRHIADLVKDGDTLQIGFGAIPNAVMKNLLDKKHLGMQTEMLPENIIELSNKGAMDNSKKEIYADKHVGSFVLGSREFYDYIDRNESIHMAPIDVTNAFDVIKEFDNYLSINATVEVDFLGQCNSETIGTHYYSATGGQADFTRGIGLTKNGLGIIALNSTARGGTISTIVPTLKVGSVVSTSKNDIDVVVTEYGVAYLKNKSIQERTAALIAIAHPDFREELKESARELGYM